MDGGETICLPCGTCRGRPADEGAAPCGACGGTGQRELTGCPLSHVPPAVWRAMDLINLYEDSHMPPVAGGALDQSCTWIAGLRLVRGERARIKLARAKQATA